MAESERGDVRPPRSSADEKTTLTQFLDYLRDAIMRKLAGVIEEQVRKPMVPSGTSLLGLAKHLTFVEMGWFRWSFAGEELEGSPQDQLLTAQDTSESVIAAYRSAIARSNQIVAGCDDLDRRAVRARHDPEPPSLRWILVHMIEETARHAGHADILREQIDGSVGR